VAGIAGDIVVGIAADIVEVREAGEGDAGSVEGRRLGSAGWAAWPEATT